MTVRFDGRWCFLLLLLAAAGLTVSGCSGSRDELPREPVSGTVSLDGQPLDYGAILFAPAAGSEGAPTSAAYDVENGQFSIPRSDGLVPGKYQVKISRMDHKPEPRSKGPPKKGTKPPKETLPTRYNGPKTELSAEIPKGGATDLKFELKSK
jgi:hypothetical protein